MSVTAGGAAGNSAASIACAAMLGEDAELIARHHAGDEMTPYERLPGDAMHGDATSSPARMASRQHDVWSIRFWTTSRRFTRTSRTPGAHPKPMRSSPTKGGWHNPRVEAVER